MTEIMFAFSAYFQHEFPIYSAKAVRFRMGHPKFFEELSDMLDICASCHIPADDEFIWTYTSPEFPMTQVSSILASHGCPFFDPQIVWFKSFQLLPICRNYSCYFYFL